MRILEPQQFNQVKRKRPKRRWLRTFVLFLVVFTLPAYTTYAYLSPLPSVPGTASPLPELADAGVSIPWPAVGQAAIGAKGFGVLAETNVQESVPTASVIKIFTALMILKEKPLKSGDTGPVITVTAHDVDVYNRYISLNGSVVPVEEGEQISEYQALQALLLPSANNIADMLATWAYGSISEYLVAAEKYAQALGLKQTRIADASGLSPGTTSTAHDIVLLGQEALNNPVISQIVDMSQAYIPVAGVVYNTNRLINSPGFVGIKTGHTDEAGGCYLFAARHEVAPGDTITVIGAILGAQDINTAINTSPAILAESYKGFGYSTLVQKGQKVGRYVTPWSDTTVDAIASESITILVWKSRMPKTTIALNPIIGGQPKDTEVGSVSVNSEYAHKSVPVVLIAPISQPSLLWRLRRYS